MAKVVVPALHLDHHGRARRIDRAERGDHRGQHRAGIVAGFAHQRFILLNHAARRHRRNHPHSFCRPGDRTKRRTDRCQRAATSSAGSARRASASCGFSGKSIEVQQHDARGRVGNDQHHIARTPGHAAKRFAQRRRPSPGAKPDVGLLKPGASAPAGSTAAVAASRAACLSAERAATTRSTLSSQATPAAGECCCSPWLIGWSR